MIIAEKNTRYLKFVVFILFSFISTITTTKISYLNDDVFWKKFHGKSRLFLHGKVSIKICCKSNDSNSFFFAKITVKLWTIKNHLFV